MRTDGELKVQIKMPRRSRASVLRLPELGGLNAFDLDRILSSASSYARRVNERTQRNFVVSVLRPLGKYIAFEFSKYPGVNFALPTTSEGWTKFVLRFRHWHMTNTVYKARLDIREGVWRKTICPWLEYLKSDSLIPLDVRIVREGLPGRSVDGGVDSSSKLLGEKKTEWNYGVGGGVKSNDNTIFGPIFWKGEAEYLDEIRASLAHKNKVLLDTLDDYWLKLVKDYRRGLEILRQISDEQLYERIQSHNWAVDVVVPKAEGWRGSDNQVMSVRVCSPLNKIGHAWALRLIRSIIESSSDKFCVSAKTIVNHPAFNSGFFHSKRDTPIEPLLDASSLPSSQLSKQKKEHVFGRFLGLMNNCDMSVAVAIIIQEHPSFTPESIAGAKIVNSSGRSYLVVTDNDERAIFSVNKPRAGSRKYALLSRRAFRIIKHILKVTAPLRRLLRRAGDPSWRYLFLGLTQSGKQETHLGHPPEIYTAHLYRQSGAWSLSQLYPELARAELVFGRLDFRRIRNTQAVLSWFENGSVNQFRKKLGNSYRVSITYYVPPVLLQAWNERLIRRFQNVLIFIAVQDESFNWAATDLRSSEQISGFVSSTLNEFLAGSSPIADKLHAAFKDPEEYDLEFNKAHDSEIYVRIDPNVIAALVLYKIWALGSSNGDLASPASISHSVTRSDLVLLATMIEQASLSSEVGEKLRETLDIERLKRCYQQAKDIISNSPAHFDLTEIRL